MVTPRLAHSPPVKSALLAADIRVAWCTCVLICWSGGNLLLYFLYLAFPDDFTMLWFTHSIYAQILSFGVGLILFAACFPDAAHAKAPGFRTRTLASAALCFADARVLLVYFRTCSRPHPCWGLVVTFGAVMVLPMTCAILRCAAGYHAGFWKHMRLSLAIAGTFQLLRTLLILAILGGADTVFPPGDKSLMEAIAIGIFFLTVAFVEGPSFRLALSNACGVAPLYALRLADLCQPDVPLWLNLEFERSHDGESTEMSESEHGDVPSAPTVFPHKLQWHPSHRTACTRSCSLGSLASSDDFAPYAVVQSSNLMNGEQSDVVRGILSRRHPKI